ncbi:MULTISPECIES: hypothetical protein [Natrialba]|uniref:hypothetical protein n=1 Tax=Natrialba TaxID=63742 RepID=UPI000B0A791E|nr:MULTISPECIES: hypothetical protein [Natrialba]
MIHPDGRCHCCGERLYGNVSGGYRCPNCQTESTDASSEEETPTVPKTPQTP